MFRFWFAFFVLIVCQISSAAPSGVDAQKLKQHINQPSGSTMLRVLHLPLWDMPLSDAKRWVDEAKSANYNTIVLMIWSGVKLNNSPWTHFANPWSPAELSDWAAYAKSKGLDVVIEVKLLSHQQFFFQESHPELMYNTKTYDPDNPAVYKIVY